MNKEQTYFAILARSALLSAVAQAEDRGFPWRGSASASVAVLLLHRCPPCRAAIRSTVGTIIAINATGLDHTPVAPDEDRVFKNNCLACASRAMAIIHTAIFTSTPSQLRGFHRISCSRPDVSAGCFSLLAADTLDRALSIAGRELRWVAGRRPFAYQG